MSKHDVIVIGSGIGGMTAALTCARSGRDVLVLEAGKQFGGFINPCSRKHYHFDVGIHYIGNAGPGQPLYQQFEDLGLLDYLSFRELNPDGFDRYVFPDYEVTMCKGADAYCARLAKDFPAEKSGLEKFFALVKKVDTTLRRAAKVNGLIPFLRLIPKLPILIKYEKATFSQVVDEFVTDFRLRAVLSGLGGDIGLPPGKASGLIMMAVIAHYLGGAYFPVGGTKKVRDSFVDALKRHGATLKRNSPVEKILVRNGRAIGARTKRGEEFLAPVVISNADVITTLKDLLGPEYLPQAVREKTERMTHSLGSLCVFIGTDMQPGKYGLDEANIWHYPTYDIDSLYQPALEGKLGEDATFFMTVPTLKDPSGAHAPPGRHTIELITFIPWQPFERWKDQKVMKRDEEYKALKNRLGMKLIEKAESYLPGLSNHLEVLEIGTPLTNASFVNVPAGAVYGPNHIPSQVGRGRFRTKGPVEGLLLCGSGVISAGIGSCVTSGVMAGEFALRHKTAPGWSLRKIARAAWPPLREART